MRNAPDRPISRKAQHPAEMLRRGQSLLALFTALLCFTAGGCTTPQMSNAPSPDALEQIPVGARVHVTTDRDETLKLRVTGTTSNSLRGRDRHFREYELTRDEIRQIDAPRQNDWWVALAWVSIVFIALG